MSRAWRRCFVLALSLLGFASLGLPDAIVGVAWPGIRSSFGLPIDALGALLFATTAGYVASSFSSALLFARLALGTVLALSCAMTAGSLIGYALAPNWPAMVALGLLAGLGAGAIDAGINAYAARHHSARALGFLHAGYGLGTTASPLLATALLARGAPWQRGYLIVGGAQVALAAIFFATRDAWQNGLGDRSAGDRTAEAPGPAPLGVTLRRSGTWLGVAAFLLYTGLEASAGAWTYSVMRDVKQLPMVAAGHATSTFWAALMCGRMMLALVPERARPLRALAGCALGMSIGTVLIAMPVPAPVAVAGLALFGLAAGPVFPLLIAGTPRRVGNDQTRSVVGLQIAAAAVGQSALPAALGVVAARSGLDALPGMLVALTACFAALTLCRRL